jgi:aldehyde dehydrogenase (NAD+)
MNLNTDIKYRKESLKIIARHYKMKRRSALYNDFKKPAFEAVLTEQLCYL